MYMLQDAEFLSYCSECNIQKDDVVNMVRRNIYNNMDTTCHLFITKHIYLLQHLNFIYIEFTKECKWHVRLAVILTLDTDMMPLPEVKNSNSCSSCGLQTRISKVCTFQINRAYTQIYNINGFYFIFFIGKVWKMFALTGYIIIWTMYYLFQTALKTKLFKSYWYVSLRWVIIFYFLGNIQELYTRFLNSDSPTVISSHESADK